MQVQRVVSHNPNASVTALAGAIMVVIIWVVGVAGVDVPAEVASAFTTIVAAVILGIDRRGRRAEANAPARTHA